MQSSVIFGPVIDAVGFGATAIARLAGFIALAVILWDLVQANRWNGAVLKRLILLIAAIVFTCAWFMLPDMFRIFDLDDTMELRFDRFVRLLAFIPHAMMAIAAVLFRRAIGRAAEIQHAEAEARGRRWSDEGKGNS
jgi:hypothetical protein